MAQQRRLAGAVAPEQRDELAGRAARSYDAGEDRAAALQLMPDVGERSTARGAGSCGGGAGRLARRLRGGRVGAGESSSSPGARSVAPGLLDAGRGRLEPQLGEQPSARRLAASARAPAPTRETRAAAASQTIRRRRARARGRPRPRQRSSRCSASSTVVPHSSLSRRSSDDQLLARDGIQLRGRLVEHEQARDAPRARRRARRAAARHLRRRRAALEQPLDAQRERDLLDAARDGVRGARHGSRAGTRARRARVPITICVSGIPEQGAHAPPAGRAVAAQVQPAHRRAPHEAPPWKCGTSRLRKRL